MRLKRNSGTVVRLCIVGSLVLAGTAAGAFSFKGINIDRTSFHTQDMQTLKLKIRAKIAEISKASFHGCTSPNDDESALNTYLETIGDQAVSEHWSTVTIKVTVAGKKSTAGVNIEYLAKTQDGKIVVGGGTMVTDRPAVNSFLRSKDQRY